MTDENILYFLVKKERAQTICHQMEGWMAKGHERNLVDSLNLDESDGLDPSHNRRSYYEPDSDEDDEMEEDPYFGEMIGESAMLRRRHFKKIRNSLPTRYRDYNWKRLFSTTTEGTSLITFYSRIENKGPTVLLIEDTNGYIFGGFASEEWHISDRFFGTGETFVFTVKPKFFCYKWTGGNDYFLHGTKDFIGMGGGGSGRYALYVDSEFLWGTSETSNTFLNRRLSCTEEFSATIVEVWGFTRSET